MTKIVNKKRKGFTLMEIMIVVIIIGILAALIAPKFMDATGTARKNALLAEHRTILGTIAMLRADKSDFGLPTEKEIKDALDGKISNTTITVGTDDIVVATVFPKGAFETTEVTGDDSLTETAGIVTKTTTVTK